MNLTRRARLIFLTVCALISIGLGFGLGFGTAGSVQPAQPSWSQITAPERLYPVPSIWSTYKTDQQTKQEQQQSANLVRPLVRAYCAAGVPVNGGPGWTLSMPQLILLCREWHFPMKSSPILAAFTRRANPTAAQYEGALHGLIHADDGQNVYDAAIGKIVRFMGDVTFDNGHDYSGIPCDHGAIVTNTPGQTDFVTLHYAYGCDGLQPVQNFSNGDEYWFGGAFATSSTIYNYGQRISTVGSSCMFGCVVGNYIASFNASTLAFEGLTQVTGPAQFMSFSSGAPWNGGFWMIGTSAPSTCPQLTDCKSAQAVFVPGGDETDPSLWQFGSGLSDNASPPPNFGTVVSLIRSGTEWVMVTKDFDLLGTHLKALTAECLVSGCIWTQVPLSTWSISTIGTSYSAQFDQYDPAPSGQVFFTYAENEAYPGFYGLRWPAPTGLPS